MAIRAAKPTKTRAPLKEPVFWMMKPMMMGVVIPAVLPKRLKRPPLSPMNSLGDVSAMTVQPSAPTPLPKKASDMRKRTSDCAVV